MRNNNNDDKDNKDNSMTMIVTAMIWSVIRKLNTGIIEMEWNGNRMEIKLSLTNNAVLQL